MATKNKPQTTSNGIPVYSSLDDGIIINSNGGSGCSAFIRKALNETPDGGFIVLADLVKAYSVESGKTTKQCGPQVRQTAERIGRLETVQTAAGKRTLLYKS